MAKSLRPSEAAGVLVSILTAAKLREDGALQEILAELDCSPQMVAVIGSAAGFIWGMLESGNFGDTDQWLQKMAIAASKDDFDSRRGWESTT